MNQRLETWGGSDAYPGAPNIRVHVQDLYEAADDLRSALASAVMNPDTPEARSTLLLEEVERHLMHAAHHYRWMCHELGVDADDRLIGYPPLPPEVDGPSE